MGSGEFFLASLAGMFLGTIVLAAYLFVLFHAGGRLAGTWLRGRSLAFGIGAIALFAWPLSLWPFATDWDPFVKAGIALAFYILHAFPLSVGFGAEKDALEEEHRRRYQKNVDDWLAAWECEPAALGSDEDEDR